MGNYKDCSSKKNKQPNKELNLRRTFFKKYLNKRFITVAHENA